jgi:hypothetical protein
MAHGIGDRLVTDPERGVLHGASEARRSSSSSGAASPIPDGVRDRSGNQPSRSAVPRCDETDDFLALAFDGRPRPKHHKSAATRGQDERAQRASLDPLVGAVTVRWLADEVGGAA